MFFIQDPVVFDEIGEVKHLPVRQPPFETGWAGFLPDVDAWRIERSKEAREGYLLLVLQVLTRQHAHRILIYGALDRPLYVLLDCLANVDVRDLGDEERMKRCYNRGHGAFPT